MNFLFSINILVNGVKREQVDFIEFFFFFNQLSGRIFEVGEKWKNAKSFDVDSSDRKKELWLAKRRRQWGRWRRERRDEWRAVVARRAGRDGLVDQV